VTPDEAARLEAIERRLAWLEARLGKATALPGAAPAFPASPAPAARPAAAVPAAKAAAPVPAPPLPKHDLETALGLTWLSRIAVLTMVLALAFFFKYAFENHWITEWGRVLLGAAAGAAGLVFGERFWRVGQRTYGQALTAAGIVFLYLSCWASNGLYHLVSQTVSFALMVLTTIAAGTAALRYDSSAVALLALAGGFATPLLLGAARDASFTFGYALVLDLGTAFASRRRDWRWPEALALGGTVVLYLSQAPMPVGMRGVYALFVIAWFILFAASSRQGVFSAAQVLAGLAMVQIWGHGGGALFAVLLIAAGSLAVADWRRWAAAAGASFGGFWLAYAVWSTLSGNPPVGASLVLASASFLLFLGWPVWRVLVRGQPLRILDLAVLALNAAFYFGAGYGLLQFGHDAWAGPLAVAAAAVQIAAARLLWRHDARGSLLSAGAAVVLLVLAVPVEFVGYRITIGWAVEGAALAWIGVRLRDQRPVIAALVTFGLVLARLMLIESFLYADATEYRLLANARFLAFSVAAASLWAAAWWIRPGLRALAAYLCGLAVMLGGLSLEAVGWAGRTAAPQDFRSVASTAISVLAAAYALLLVGGGVARRSPATRIAGMVLIGLVVGKLYLYDIWLLSQFYRMAAFGILGVLLLAISFLYSRFRGTIQNWWRPQS